MIYPTDLLRAFAVICSWRIQKSKIVVSLEFTKIENCFYLIVTSKRTVLFFLLIVIALQFYSFRYL